MLRPGGTLVLVWNTRDRSLDWVRAFGDLLVDGDGDRPYDAYTTVDYPRVVSETGGFSSLQEWTVSWTQPFDAELLVVRAASVSVVAALPDGERERVLERVAALAATHPDLVGRAIFDFPYTTRVQWCRRE